MCRDWDTIRSVLLDVEASTFGGPEVSSTKTMAHDAGFVRFDNLTLSLTHMGHDLIDAIRDDRVWDCCRRAIALNAGGLPSDLLLDVARCIIRDPVLIIKSDGPIPDGLEPDFTRYT